MAMLRSHGITRDARANRKQRGTRMRSIRRIDSAWYYEQQMLGFNYRMTDIQAALGASQLDGWTPTSNAATRWLAATTAPRRPAAAVAARAARESCPRFISMWSGLIGTPRTTSAGAYSTGCGSEASE